MQLCTATGAVSVTPVEQAHPGMTEAGFGAVAGDAEPLSFSPASAANERNTTIVNARVVM